MRRLVWAHAGRIGPKIPEGEHLTPEFEKKNKFKKVPAIIDDGFPLSESGAIMRYIAVSKKLDDHWYPKSDPKLQARVDEFLHWHHTGLRAPCVTIFLEVGCDRMPTAGRPKKPMDEKKVAAAKAELAKALKNIEDYFLQGKKFIGGDKVSAADLIGVNELYQLHGVGLLDDLVSSAKNKKAKDWMDRVMKALGQEFDLAVAKIKDGKKKYDAAAGQAKK